MTKLDEAREAYEATRTNAVLAGLMLVRNHGGTMGRFGDGTPSNHAGVVGYALLRGQEAVQQEFDAYIEASHRLVRISTGQVA